MSQERTRFPIQPQDVRRSARSSEHIRSRPNHFGAEQARTKRERRRALLDRLRRRGRA